MPALAQHPCHKVKRRKKKEERRKKKEERAQLTLKGHTSNNPKTTT